MQLHHELNLKAHGVCTLIIGAACLARCLGFWVDRIHVERSNIGSAGCAHDEPVVLTLYMLLRAMRNDGSPCAVHQCCVLIL